MRSAGTQRPPALWALALPGLVLAVVGASCALTFPDDYDLAGEGSGTGTGGAATLAPNGARCGSSDECNSGQCLPSDSESGSVCCATACTEMAAATCGETGKCDPGGAACAPYPAGTVCGETKCENWKIATDRCQAGACTPGGLADEPPAGDVHYQVKLNENGSKPNSDIVAKRCDAADPQCSSPIEDVMVLQTGDISVTAPSSFYGYLDTSGGGYKPVLIYLGPPNGLPSPTEPVPVFNGTFFSSILVAAGLNPENPERGHLLVLGADCSMNPSAGIFFTARSADGATQRFYFTSSTAVNKQATETTAIGLGGFTNVPPGEVLVQAFRAENGSTPIGEATVTVRPQTITMLRLGPTLGGS